MARPGNFRPLLTAGILLGVGLGGLAENVIFRQMFQTHEFLSGRIPASTPNGLKASLVWGGWFEALSLVVILLSLRLLWRAGRRGDVPWRGNALGGALLLGWGLYTCVEGVLAHQMLGLHHLVESSRIPFRVYWDISYLAAGAVALALGGEIIRKDHLLFLKRKKEWQNARQGLSAVVGPAKNLRGKA